MIAVQESIKKQVEITMQFVEAEAGRLLLGPTSDPRPISIMNHRYRDLGPWILTVIFQAGGIGREMHMYTNVELPASHGEA